MIQLARTSELRMLSVNVMSLHAQLVIALSELRILDAAKLTVRIGELWKRIGELI
jgi:hypothetical protein